jgi:hypothetical protein
LEGHPLWKPRKTPVETDAAKLNDHYKPNTTTMRPSRNTNTPVGTSESPQENGRNSRFLGLKRWGEN